MFGKFIDMFLFYAIKNKSMVNFEGIVKSILFSMYTKYVSLWLCVRPTTEKQLIKQSPCHFHCARSLFNMVKGMFHLLKPTVSKKLYIHWCKYHRRKFSRGNRNATGIYTLMVSAIMLFISCIQYLVWNNWTINCYFRSITTNLLFHIFENFCYRNPEKVGGIWFQFNSITYHRVKTWQSACVPCL